jgi:phage-related protein
LARDCSSCGLGAARASAGRFYCFVIARRIVVVHAFIKKSQQTPDKALRLARKRVKELSNG